MANSKPRYRHTTCERERGREGGREREREREGGREREREREGGEREGETGRERERLNTHIILQLMHTHTQATPPSHAHLCISHVPRIVTDGAPSPVEEDLHPALCGVLPAHQPQVRHRSRRDVVWITSSLHHHFFTPPPDTEYLKAHAQGQNYSVLYYDYIIITSYPSTPLLRPRSVCSCVVRDQSWSTRRERFPCQRRPRRPTRSDLRVT